MNLFKDLGRFLHWVCSKYIPNKRSNPVFSETREKITLPIRETNPVRNKMPKASVELLTGISNGAKTIQKAENLPIESAKTPDTYPCPYCSSKNTVRRGIRKKKYEIQQRYLCNDCQRSFVPQKVKGKSFPLSIILEGLSLYNTGFTLEESC